MAENGYIEGMRNPENWQISQYNGQIVAAMRIPLGRVLAGYVGRLLVSRKNDKYGSLIIRLSPYTNFYDGNDPNLEGLRIQTAEKHKALLERKNQIYFPRGGNHRAIRKSLRLNARDIGTKIEIEILADIESDVSGAS